MRLFTVAAGQHRRRLAVGHLPAALLVDLGGLGDVRAKFWREAGVAAFSAALGLLLNEPFP